MATEIIAGDFELDRAKLLGKGAWGDVYVGKQVSLNRPVAIKFLKKELTVDADFVRRFRREAECLAKLAEEHIIQVYSAGEYQGEHYFIMEFVQGAPLSKLVETKHKFTIEDIVHVAVSVAKALKAAWNSPAQIVHRDIKPANIMISFSSSIISPSPEKAEKTASLMLSTLNIKETQVKVMDFGLAKLATGGDHEATMVGTVIGTPKYISPEQGMGNPADTRSDIYSLGIVLYEMATGKIPFEGESAMSMIRHHIYDTAMMISQNMADFPPALEAIIMKCIQKAPEKRYETPAKLLEDLDAFEKNKPLVHATIDPERAAAAGMDATMLAPGAAVYQRRKKKIMITAGAVVTAAVVGALAFWQPWKEPPIISHGNIVGGISGTDTAGIGISPGETALPEDPVLKEVLELQKQAEAKYQQGLDEKSSPVAYPLYEEAKKIIGDIFTKKEGYEPAVKLLEKVQKKMDEYNEKLRLVKAMIADTLKSIDDPKTKEQQKFVLIIQAVESNDFTAAHKETDKLIEFEDDLVPPAATYLQMRVWFVSLEGDYLKEMKGLYNRFRVMYPKSEVLPLAEKLLAEAGIKQDELAVEKIIADSDREAKLETRAKMLDNFVKANLTNQFIQRVKDKWSVTLEAIESLRQKNYSDTIAKANQQRQANLYREAYATLEVARQYTQDYTEIETLKAQTEKEFLQFNGMAAASDQKDPDLMVYRAITNIKDSSVMVLIPAGEFTRGDENGAPEEKPAVKINLAAYYADKLEITNEQFRKFVEDDVYVTDAELEHFGWVYNDGVLEPVKNACWKDPKGTGEGIEKILNHPVVQVSWKDALNYATWARKRLLTEAEWEKLARSDKQLIFPWGEKYLPKSANIGEDGPGQTVPVGSYLSDKSPYECFDIAGNVAEWCADYFDPTYYAIRTADNPKGPTSGTAHIIRGGSWISSPGSIKLTVRRSGVAPSQEKSAGKDQSQFWSNYLGFRCARDVVTLTK